MANPIPTTLLFPLSRIAGMVTLALSFPLLAQENDNDVIESITVTAQKRAQSIQDVPVSISAVSGDDLNALGIFDLDALSDITPGLIIQEQSPNNPGFVIRGITSDSGSAQIAPRVSIYYNGVDISRSRGSYFELFDMERIEVVKGPQATLFGTAASVGALSAITKKPEQEFSAQIKGGFGNYSARTLQGYVTGGDEVFQGRLAFSYRERDGFIDNIAGQTGSQTPGGIQQDDMQGIERTALRASLRATPNDSLTIDFVFTYEENDDTGTSFKNGLLAPTGGDTSPFTFVEMSGSPLAEEVFGKSDLGIERDTQDFNLTVNYDLSDTLTFTSVTAGRSFDSLEVFDADGSQAWFLEFAEDAEGDQFSQEFRVVQTGNSYTNIYGFNFFTEDGSQAVPFSTEESVYLNCLGFLADFGQPCINADGSVNVLSPFITGGPLLDYQAEFSNYGENTSYSFFFDSTFDVTDKLELTLGVRYITEERISGYSSVSPNSVLSGGPLLPVVSTEGRVLEAEDEFDDILPRFNALYRLNNDTNLFATVSKGRRSEVLDVSSRLDDDAGVVADVTLSPAEIIWNYEVGAKGKAMDQRLDYSVSVFYQDYSDFQVTQQDDAGQFFTTNAGSATNAGIEAEVRALLTSDWEVFANVAYIDATIDDDSENGELAGNRFRLQPETTFSTGVFYNTEISDGYQLTGSLMYSYRSEVFFEEDNAPISGLDIKQGDVSLVNAKMGIGDAQSGWTVSVFVNNLLDEEYLVDAGNTGGAFGYPTFVAGPPRFYGIEFSKAFGE